MAWVFQGNPKRFDIDDYLARYPELVYWRAPRYSDQISPGDIAYIWRSGRHAGAVAKGRVVEGPCSRAAAEHPAALGDDLWWADAPDPTGLIVGIRLEEVRLTASEGAVPRERVVTSPALAGTSLIRMPQATVFPLTGDQVREMDRLWYSGDTAFDGSADEGQRRMRAHRRRERSRWLRDQKLQEVRESLGKLACQLCGTAGTRRYPGDLAGAIFEVHHLSPLGTAATPTRTTLDDLAVLCANCHRAVHASEDVESNFASLERSFLEARRESS